jgi:prepilin signal peptidase PulO-like enzyme (type II secretory pathway)
MSPFPDSNFRLEQACASDDSIQQVHAKLQKTKPEKVGGYSMLPLIILLSSVVGAAIGISLIVFKGRDHSVPLAFGPYLAIAGGIALFFGPALIKGWYL